MNRWQKAEASPFPSDVTWVEEEQSFNFSLYSKHADAVRRVLYSPDDLVHPAFEYDFDYRCNKSGRSGIVASLKRKFTAHNFTRIE